MDEAAGGGIKRGREILSSPDRADGAENGQEGVGAAVEIET